MVTPGQGFKGTEVRLGSMAKLGLGDSCYLLVAGQGAHLGAGISMSSRVRSRYGLLWPQWCTGVAVWLR
jgi:hypothetical protein